VGRKTVVTVAMVDNDNVAVSFKPLGVEDLAFMNCFNCISLLCRNFDAFLKERRV